MTEKSYFWSCAAIGDGGPDSFSQEAVMNWLGAFGVTYNPELTGIIPWKNTNNTYVKLFGLAAIAPTGELVPTYNSGTLTIDTGLAISGGIFYVNDTAVDFDIPTYKSGYANGVDRIVLRRELVTQTTRLTYVRSTGAGLTAPLQNDLTYWDVPIARITLDGSGNYSSLTDDRQYVNSPSSGRVLLYDYEVPTSPTSAVYTMNIANTRYTELELLVDLKPISSNFFLDIYFSPLPTNPTFVRQELRAEGAVVTTASVSSTTAWRWTFGAARTNFLKVNFPMYNRYNARVILQGERVGTFVGDVDALTYITGTLKHSSTSTVSATLTDLVVSVDPTVSGTSIVPDGRIKLYGIK